MIKFTSISYKNFLSTGNVPNTIRLDAHKSTLITGKNGDGKSTILDAICFALFGKPFRQVFVKQLVNSINNKDCLVEVEFETGDKKYKVVRGVKPNVFDIICDGVVINQDAAVKDYQKVLEQQILRINYRTFTQVVILGSATFVPFMQMQAKHRREVIEDILDIGVFSAMNKILKERASGVKEASYKIESDMRSKRIQIEAQKSMMKMLISSKEESAAALRSRITANLETIESYRNDITVLEKEISEDSKKIDRIKEIQDAMTPAINIKAKVSAKLDSDKRTVKFFTTSSECPHCRQGITEEYKDHILGGISREIDEATEKLNGIMASIKKMEEAISRGKSISSVVQSKNIEIAELKKAISMIESQNTEMEEEIKGSRDRDSSDIDAEKEKLHTLIDEGIALSMAMNDTIKDKKIIESAYNLLKDEGIKSAIIREYLPVINRFVNEYLDAMDFFVHFELDELFNETIRSRGRDSFSYDSFSEGEKRKIDLAVMFTWRRIAKEKNSVNTNLLILDEILDGSLDANSIDCLLNIMNQLHDSTNVFVISHRDMVEQFDNTIKFIKSRDFSEML